MSRRKKATRLTRKPVTIHVRPICVNVRHEATDFEGGTDSHVNGDDLIERMDLRGTKYDLATDLRRLADFVAGSTGNPTRGYTVFILTSRAR